MCGFPASRASHTSAYALFTHNRVLRYLLRCTLHDTPTRRIEEQAMDKTKKCRQRRTRSNSPISICIRSAFSSIFLLAIANVRICEALRSTQQISRRKSLLDGRTSLVRQQMCSRLFVATNRINDHIRQPTKTCLTMRDSKSTKNMAVSFNSRTDSFSLHVVMWLCQ